MISFIHGLPPKQPGDMGPMMTLGPGRRITVNCDTCQRDTWVTWPLFEGDDVEVAGAVMDAHRRRHERQNYPQVGIEDFHSSAP